MPASPPGPAGGAAGERRDPLREASLLADAVIDGSADSDQFERLDRLIREDPAARLAYVTRLDLHAQLTQTVRRDAGRAEPEVVGELLAGGRRRRDPRRARLLAATAVASALSLCLFAAAFVIWSRPTPAPALLPVATVSRVSSSEAAAVGATLFRGVPFEVPRGFVNCVLPVGTEVGIAGPATVTFVAPHELHVARGRVAVDVAKEAPFEVVTPAMTVTDLGTRFGVSVAPGGATDAVVFEGRVLAEAAAENSTRPLLLTAGRAASAAPGRALAMTEPPAELFERLVGWSGGIAWVDGPVRTLSVPPASVEPDRCEANGVVTILRERDGLLDAGLPRFGRNLVGTAPEPSGEHGPIPVRSYLFHFDPEANDDSVQEVRVSVRFRDPIVAIAQDERFVATHADFGLPEVRYPLAECGLEKQDTLEISPDGLTLDVVFSGRGRAEDGIARTDSLRVFTRGHRPAPAGPRTLPAEGTF